MQGDENVELKLLANLEIDIGNGLRFRAPTLKKLVEIGPDAYDRMISALLIRTDQLVDLPDIGLTHFELFYIQCRENSSYWLSAKTGLAAMLNGEPRLGENKAGCFVCFDDREEMRLDRSNFDFFQSLILFSHNIKFEKEQYNPANAKAKALIEQLRKGRDEILRKKEQIFDLASKISGIAWKSNGINILNVFDLNIYQFHDALLRLEHVDHYLFTLQGIYAGNVDAGKINISNIHWSRKH